MGRLTLLLTTATLTGAAPKSAKFRGRPDDTPGMCHVALQEQVVLSPGIPYGALAKAAVNFWMKAAKNSTSAGSPQYLFSQSQTVASAIAGGGAMSEAASVRKFVNLTTFIAAATIRQMHICCIRANAKEACAACVASTRAHVAAVYS